jgi:hypothetical protein
MAPVQSRTHLDWDATYTRYGSQLARYEELLESYEREFGVTLTPGAIEMIFVPVIECLDANEQVDYGRLDRTFGSLVEQMAMDPDGRDSSTTRSSRSVARAFHSLWCNLPPICRPHEEDR